MSLVTRGMGPSNMLVTGGFGNYSTLLAQIVEENLGGLQFSGEREKRTFALMQYSFTVPHKTLIKATDAIEDISDRETANEFLNDYVIVLDGNDYGLMLDPINSEEFLNRAKSLPEKIETAQRELSVSRQEAINQLIERAKKEYQKTKELQDATFKNDIDLIEILILADEL